MDNLIQKSKQCSFQSWNELKIVDENYLKFLIVRDPLDRLVSCYKDKMVKNTHWSLANFRRQVKQRANLIRSKRKYRIGQKQSTVESKRPKRYSEKKFLDMATQFWDDSGSFSQSISKHQSNSEMSNG